ncbi:hypothetical protein GE061_013923 [Apolygus lucorum]|uniref:Uncharacterized protein n=1 Tax=Apolygus lucorum TaxID=248454 RepID=A0A8S9XP30_APOLU|nr:hypothetical protein GE061_013923 [Apolygus lucorum]
MASTWRKALSSILPFSHAFDDECCLSLPLFSREKYLFHTVLFQDIYSISYRGFPSKVRFSPLETRESGLDQHRIFEANVLRLRRSSFVLVNFEVVFEKSSWITVAEYHPSSLLRFTFQQDSTFRRRKFYCSTNIIPFQLGGWKSTSFSSVRHS